MFAALGVVGAKVRKSGYFQNFFVREGFEKRQQPRNVLNLRGCCCYKGFYAPFPFGKGRDGDFSVLVASDR